MSEVIKRWYVLQVYSGYESKVKDYIVNRINTFDLSLQSKFGRILVPSEEVMEMKLGQKKLSKRKFFPGYVLIEMEMSSKLWHLVCRDGIPNVVGFIGGNSPTPLSEKEALKLLNKVENESSAPVPKTIFEIGEVVRIIHGPFSDFDGVIEEVNYEKGKVKVSVLIFGRSTPVELDFKHIEKN